MEKSIKAENRILGIRASLIKGAWMNISLIVLAVVMVVIGIFFSLGSQGANRDDIASYNEALSTYFSVDYIPPTDWDPPQYPIVNLLKTASYFQQAASQSTDNSLKSAALFNIGTVIGRDYLAFMAERMPGLDLKEAVSKLSEAVRIDPSNEDAKYNLEFLEKVQTMVQESGGSPEALLGGAIVTPAIGFKGY